MLLLTVLYCTHVQKLLFPSLHAGFSLVYLFSIFNEAFSTAYVIWHRMIRTVNDKLGRMWKESVMTYFMVLMFDCKNLE
jgi:hypothetical protein